MTGPTRVALTLCLASMVAACSGGGEPPPAPASKTIALTASSSSVLADGTASVKITVDRGDGVPVKLTTARGTWKETRTATLTLESGAGSPELVTCDSRSSFSCAGPNRISAFSSSDDARGNVTVTFLQEENCNNGSDDNGDGKIDCADPQCQNQGCNLSGSDAGTGTCDVSGVCLCASGSLEVCSDGLDNNCDGKIDCKDTTCLGKTCKLPGGGNGLCNATDCACPNTPEVCNDGVDNDCDGLVDCNDPNCQPSGNALGKACDAKGNTCSSLLNGTSSCNICSGNGGTAQTASTGETSCGDGTDNDCDGLIDCQDPDCDALACTSTGKRCSATTLTCVCNGSEAAGETTCNDGLDNDCDGLIDCDDPNCQPLNGNPARTCGLNGKFCTAGAAGRPADVACACNGNGGTPQATETSCNDGKDNDCDGKADCDDSDCQPTSAGGTDGKNCSSPSATPVTVGKKCDITAQCICPGGQNQEASCGDGVDNDCDGLVDCADPDCLNKSCSGAGKTCIATSASGCTCPGLQAGGETSCGDNIDNDCDGLVDCEDSNCIGKSCNSGNAVYVCSAPVANPAKPSICQDPGASFTLNLTATRGRIPADGVATTMISAVLKDSSGVAQTSKSVGFTVSAGTGSISPASATTNSSGMATAIFTSGASGGTSTITAQFGSVTATLNIDQPALGQVKFISQQYSVMGVRYSSFQEANDLTFQLLDPVGATYPAGLTVNFTHAPVGTSFIGPTASCSLTQCTATGVTDAAGFVKVTLHSGTVASVVSVTATATAGGAVVTSIASNIAFVGATPSGSHIAIDCRSQNVPAFTDNNCSNSFLNQTVTCHASFADRFNNVLGVSTLATFSTEAGAAGPPASSPGYNPSQPPSGQTGLGQATGFVLVGGYSLPKDVAPISGEYSLTYDDGCGLKTHNPRDGLVSVIVSATGEEGFVDGSNGKPANGIYDLGENFIDLGEPFVDADDNGVQNNNEFYVDANNNGVWDGPNGVWDQQTVIWTETRIVYTGFPIQIYDSINNQDYASRWYPSVGQTRLSSPSPTTPPGFSVAIAQTGPPAIPATTQKFGLYVTDGNFNEPTISTAYALTATNVTATLVQTPSAGVDRTGILFTQQFCGDKLGTTACSNTCTTAPCYVVGSVAGFSYGGYGQVSVTAASTVGAADVRANATLQGVTLPVVMNGVVN